MNHVTLSTIATYTPLKRDIQTSTGNGRSQGYSLRTKVKTSIEGDVLAKDSTTSESVDDSGKTSYIFIIDDKGEAATQNLLCTHMIVLYPYLYKLKLHLSEHACSQ